MGSHLLGPLTLMPRGKSFFRRRLTRNLPVKRGNIRTGCDSGRHRSPYGEMPMVGYKYSILEAKTQADIDRRTNDQEQAGYRLASFFITDQGHLRGEAV